MTEGGGHDWRPRHNAYLVALTVTLATFMEVLDTSIANVSLPHIAGNLSATVDESTWVLTSYLVANAIILPLSGWLSSVLGRKRFYMTCVALFAASSALCGFAPTLGWLVIFRIIQGLGGGGLQPSEQAILHDIFPPERLGMGMAVYGVAVVTAPIIGPTLGGWITDNYSWRWIFFINVPVGLVSLYLSQRMVEDPPYLKRRDLSRGLNLDGVGLALLVLGIGALQFVLDKGQREDWFASHLIAVLSATAVIALVSFIVYELRHRDPIVDLHLFKDRNFAVSIVLMFMLGAVLFGSTVLLPFFLQTLMGYPATTSGLVLSPGGLATMACMPVVGMMLGRFQARWLILWGLGVGAFSLGLMSHFNLDISYRVAMLTRVVQASGLAFLFVPINTVAYAFVPKDKNNAASGLINLARNLGGSTGIAVATTLLTRQAQVHQTVLVGHLTPYDPAFRRALAGAVHAVVARGLSPAQARTAAEGLLYGNLLRHSTMLAFLDDFRFLMAVFILTMPLVLLLKSQLPGKKPAVVMD